MKEAEEMTNLNIKKNVCLNCLSNLVSERENSNNQISSEISNLKNALKVLNEQISSKEFEDIKNLNEKELDAQENLLLQQFEELKNEETQTKNELDEYLNELSNLHQEEQNCWDLFNKIEESTIKLEKNKQFILNKYKCYESEIKQFSNSSLIDSLFNITCYDKYGVINGARLGFGSSIIYDEINAGLGYIVFLTSIVAKKFEYEWKNFELVPMGNYSKIIRKENNIIYELNTSGSSKNSTEKFNDALQAYLEALRELHEYLLVNNKITTIISNSDLNVKIGESDINGYPIKYDYNQPENWSQCMKFLLIILKNYIYNVLKKEEDEYKEIVDKVKILTSLKY